MWSEPLTASAEDQSAHTFATVVRDGTGKPVAGVQCVVNRHARTGWFGAMQIGDPHGGARQKVRALVLLVRESLAHAAALGITDVRTEATPRMAAFARKLTGLPGVDYLGGNAVHFRGRLADIRTRALRESDATGNVDGL